MNISELKPGAVFVECDAAEWASLSKKDKSRTPRTTYDGFLELCRQYPGRRHIRTSKGQWCIHDNTPVVVLHESSARVKQEAA